MGTAGLGKLLPVKLSHMWLPLPGCCAHALGDFKGEYIVAVEVAGGKVTASGYGSYICSNLSDEGYCFGGSID